MSAVEKYLFMPLYQPRGWWGVVRWWEERRLLFNVVVGSAGLLTLGVISLFAHLPPHGRHAGVPLGAVVAYGIAANLGYCLGPVADIVLRRLLGERAPAVAPALFRHGLTFSIGLTLLPMPLGVLAWIARFF